MMNDEKAIEFVDPVSQRNAGARRSGPDETLNASATLPLRHETKKAQVPAF
jgi:hypothetical protein